MACSRGCSWACRGRAAACRSQQPGPAKRCGTWKGLQADIVHDLVVAALEEGAVDGCKGDHALAGQASCKRHGMLHTQARLARRFLLLNR